MHVILFLFHIINFRTICLYNIQLLTGEMSKMLFPGSHKCWLQDIERNIEDLI